MRDSLINTCGMKMRKLLDKKSEVFAQKYGVRNVELEILLFLYHSPCGDTAKDIVEEKNLSKAHISKSVDNLRAKGFVVLTEDENDRRKRHIELTEKAVEAAKNMMEETKVRLYDLKVNYQKNPMGIDLHNPVFSWKIKESKGTCQDYSRVWISENEVFTKLVFDSCLLYTSDAADEL